MSWLSLFRSLHHFSLVHAHTLTAQSLPHFFIACISAMSRDAPVAEDVRVGLEATAAQASRKGRIRSQFAPHWRNASISASRLVLRSTAKPYEPDFVLYAIAPHSCRLPGRAPAASSATISSATSTRMAAR